MSKKLNDTKRAAVVAAMLSTGTMQETAKAVGVTRNTVSRWLTQDAKLHAMIREAERAMQRAFVLETATDLEANMATLRRIRDDEGNAPGVRVRAVLAINDMALSWRELATLQDEVDELRAMYGDLEGRMR